MGSPVRQARARCAGHGSHIDFPMFPSCCYYSARLDANRRHPTPTPRGKSRRVSTDSCCFLVFRVRLIPIGPYKYTPEFNRLIVWLSACENGFLKFFPIFGPTISLGVICNWYLTIACKDIIHHYIVLTSPAARQTVSAQPNIAFIFNVHVAQCLHSAHVKSCFVMCGIFHAHIPPLEIYSR